MDSPVAGPTNAFDGYTYEGESVVEAVRVSGGTVGVTTHRVLALTPGDSGSNFGAVDLPNVESIEVSSGGNAAHGVRALRYGVYGIALLGASYLLQFDTMGSIDPPAAAGAGQVVGMALTLTRFLSVVDDVLRLAGAVVIVGALLFAALYGHSRGRHLEIGVAGDDPIEVPLRKSEPVAADRILAAVEKTSNPSDG